MLQVFFGVSVAHICNLSYHDTQEGITILIHILLIVPKEHNKTISLSKYPYTADTCRKKNSAQKLSENKHFAGIGWLACFLVTTD